MGELRGWFGWAASWTLVAQLPIWLAATREVLEQGADPSDYVVPVPDWLPTTVLVVTGTMAVALGLLLVGLGVGAFRRAGLLLGGVALLVAAVVWSGFAGPWYVGLSGLAGAMALAAGGRRGLAVPAPVAGVALVVAAGFLGWTCRQGAAYWHWRLDSAQGYFAGLGVAAVLVVLGLLVATGHAGWLAPLLRPAGVVAAAVGAGLCFVAGVLLVELEVLYLVVDESEPALGFGTPAILAGVGLLATAVASWRRRASLAGLSLSAAVCVGLLALWQEPTWGRLMS